MTTLNRALAIVSMFFSLAACGPDGGNDIKTAGDGLAACGPDGGSHTNDGDTQSKGDASPQVALDGGSQAAADGGTCKLVTPSAAAQQFIGAWRLVSGTTTCTCSGGQAESTTADGTDIETFTAGCEPDQVIGFDANVPCPETCTVSGTVAACQPLTCLTNGVEVQSTQDVYTLVNGELDEVGGGVVSGSGVSCQCASSDGVLQRVQ